MVAGAGMKNWDFLSQRSILEGPSARRYTGFRMAEGGWEVNESGK
jgi:hypothetical protein